MTDVLTQVSAMDDSQKRFELFKFYEEASQRTKSHAWTQTTWVLTLSGAVLAFSMERYLDPDGASSFLFMLWSASLAGVLLSAYVMWVLHELAIHIRTYLTAANRLAAQDPFLKEYIGPNDALKALDPKYQAAYPAFICRLFFPPSMFALGHMAWAIYVTAHCAA